MAGSSASRRELDDCWILEKAKAVAAVPTRAARDADDIMYDLRCAAFAVSRMARRVIGATSFSLAARTGSMASATASPLAARTARTALAVWEPREERNNAEGLVR